MHAFLEKCHYFRNHDPYRALKSREISRENTGIFAHMWHQRSLLGVNQSRPVTLKDHWQSKAMKVA